MIILNLITKQNLEKFSKYKTIYTNIQEISIDKQVSPFNCKLYNSNEFFYTIKI